MEDPQVQPGDGTDETNAKNLKTTFDGGLGDDFLLSWKPSKINSTAKFDIDDGLPPVPNKKLKMPDDFDIDMPNFDPDLTSKLSSFDVDLDFFESSDKEGSRDENGGSQNTQSQISKDQNLIILSESEESSSLSEQEKDCVLIKSVDFENTSSLRSRDQHVDRSKVVDFDSVSSWKSQEESRRNADTIGHNSDTSLVKRREALITERADEHVTLTTLPVESMVEVAFPARKVTLPQNLSNQVSSSLHEKCETAPPEKEHHSVRVDEIRNGTEISDLQLSKEKYTREVHSSKDAACIPMSVDVKNEKQLPIPMNDLGLRVQPVHSPRELKSSRQTRITAKRSSSEKPLHGHGSSTAVRALSFENDPPSTVTEKEAEEHRLLRKRTSMSPTFPIAEGERHDPSTSLESLKPVQVDSTLNTSKPHPLPSSSEEQKTGALSSKAVHHKVQKPNATTKIDKVDSFQDIKSSVSRAKGNGAHGYTWNITS